MRLWLTRPESSTSAGCGNARSAVSTHREGNLGLRALQGEDGAACEYIQGGVELLQKTVVITAMDVHTSLRRNILNGSETFISTALSETILDHNGNLLLRRLEAFAGTLSFRLA